MVVLDLVKIKLQYLIFFVYNAFTIQTVLIILTVYNIKCALLLLMLKLESFVTILNQKCNIPHREWELFTVTAVSRVR